MPPPKPRKAEDAYSTNKHTIRARQRASSLPAGKTRLAQSTAGWETIDEAARAALLAQSDAAVEAEHRAKRKHPDQATSHEQRLYTSVASLLDKMKEHEEDSDGWDTEDLADDSDDPGWQEIEVILSEVPPPSDPIIKEEPELEPQPGSLLETTPSYNQGRIPRTPSSRASGPSNSIGSTVATRKTVVDTRGGAPRDDPATMVALRPPFVTTRVRSRPAIRRVIKKKPALLIDKEPFARLVHEITQDIAPEVNFQRSALLTLQEIVESHLVQMFNLGLADLQVSISTRVTQKLNSSRPVNALQR